MTRLFLTATVTCLFLPATVTCLFLPATVTCLFLPASDPPVSTGWYGRWRTAISWVYGSYTPLSSTCSVYTDGGCAGVHCTGGGALHKKLGPITNKIPRQFLRYNASKYTRNSSLRSNMLHTSSYCGSQTGPAPATFNLTFILIHINFRDLKKPWADYPLWTKDTTYTLRSKMGMKTSLYIDIRIHNTHQW